MSKTKRYELLLQAATLAAGANDVGQLAAQVLTPLAAAFDNAVAGMFVHDSNGYAVCFPQTSLASIEAMGGYERSSIEGDPDPLHDLKMRLNPRIAVTSELISSAVLRRSAIYSNLYRRFDAEHHLVARVSGIAFGSPGSVGLVIARSRNQPFERDEVDAFARLLPIFDAVVERNRRDRELDHERIALGELATRNGDGAVLAFTCDGQLSWMSDAAAAILTRSELPSVLVDAVRRLGALPSATDAPASCELQVILGPHLVAKLFLTAATDDKARLVLARLVRSKAAPIERAAAAFRLTPAERGVLEVLADGATNEQISLHLGIAKDTVRAHLKRIFDKVCVHSRLEAIVKLRDLDRA